MLNSLRICFKVYSVHLKQDYMCIKCDEDIKKVLIKLNYSIMILKLKISSYCLFFFNESLFYYCRMILIHLYFLKFKKFNL